MAETETISNVTDNTFQTEVVDASNAQPVMVDFWADWCRPCHMLAPTVAEIARDYAGRLKVVKLNVDENVNSAGRYNIRGIPTLLIFKGGQVADQIVGAVPKEQISKIVDRHMNEAPSVRSARRHNKMAAGPVLACLRSPFSDSGYGS